MSGAANAFAQHGHLDIDFPRLVHQAARLRGQKIAFLDRTDQPDGRLTVAQFSRLVEGYAAGLQLFGLKPGERIAILGSEGAHAFAALTGALRAGLDGAVAGPHLDAGELGQFADAIGASAVITGAGRSDEALAAQILQAAGQAKKVRLVLSLASSAPDGMVCLKAADISVDKVPEGEWPPPSAARIITRTLSGHAAIHAQHTLITAGLDFIANLPVNSESTLISTIVPASFAGLVCGPVAGLLSGAATRLHSPFDGKSFLQEVRQYRPVCIVIPAMLLDQMAASSVWSDQDITALVLLHRLTPPDHGSARDQNPTGGGALLLADLYAFGEQAAVAERRGPDGVPRAPLQTNHTLALHGQDILAARAITHFVEKDGVRKKAVTLEGAAVSKTNWMAQ